MPTPRMDSGSGPTCLTRSPMPGRRNVCRRVGSTSSWASCATPGNIWTSPKDSRVVSSSARLTGASKCWTAIALRDVYLPDNDEKGRSLREEGKHVLEMDLREANRLAEVLVEATAVRLASELVERDVVDGTEWTGSTDRVRALEETHYWWLPTPLLAIQAHGGSNPTGHATAGWDAAHKRLRGAGVVECESIAVELVAGEEMIARSEPVARWLKGDVLGR